MRYDQPKPPPVPCGGQWNAYVESGATVEERRARLAECPPELRPGVESHVRTVFQIRAKRAKQLVSR
jgi:hypothetical protein